MSLLNYHGKNGWRIEKAAVIAGSGLVLQGVSHANYQLARDMRVVAIWAGTGDPHKPDPKSPVSMKKLRLGAPELPPAGTAEPVVIEMPPPPPDFNYHPADFALTASFKSPAAVFPDQGIDRLTVTQNFQFASYGIDPPHEPGGVLPAARLLPLLTIRCDRPEGAPDSDIRYLRIDYRVNYVIEPFSEKSPDDPATPFEGPVAPNQVGIFRDQDGPPPLLSNKKTVIYTPAVTPPSIDQVFYAGEKPLTYEVVGRGLERGSAVDKNGKPWSWDNIHQWCASNGLPTTPGAFDACHTHWRWGAVSGQSSADLPFGKRQLRQLLIPAAGQQFQGYGWTTDRGGPLIDHRVPDQTMTFAITKNHEDAGQDVSRSVFADQFTGKPADISDGTDLVQWFSVEIFRRDTELQQPWEGTLFIHGSYFAHSPTPVLLPAIAAGLDDPLHVPPEKDGRSWTFNPS